MRNILLIFLLFIFSKAVAQELNCTVVVNAQQTGNENLPIFKTLERQLTEFVNNTTWTNSSFKPQERINCSMVINIQSYESDVFRGTIQVQSSRPVFNSSYSTPVLNFNDKDFTFQYLEFQNLVYNPNQFESNLISVITFHVFMILGMDADTFQFHGGDNYFNQAQNILIYSQQENYKGWKLEDGNQTRYTFIDNILSPTFEEFRSAIYEYHLKGLDEMSNDAKKGKTQISNAIQELSAMNSRRPNSFLIRVFFDAKADEIEEIFTDGPSVNIDNLVSVLTKIAPTYSSKWRNISF